MDGGELRRKPAGLPPEQPSDDGAPRAAGQAPSPRRRGRRGVSGSPRRGNMRAMSLREERREENQRRFRRANEALHDLVDERVPDTQPVAFVCECADDECMGRVEVSLEDWEAVASKPNHFLMEADHQRSEGEEVVGSLGEYQIARKPD
jgi:hypothetical protein